LKWKDEEGLFMPGTTASGNRIVEVGIRDTIFCGDPVASQILPLTKIPGTGTRPPKDIT